MDSMITGNFLLLGVNQSLRVGCPLQKQGLWQESPSCETTSDGTFACSQAQPRNSLIQRPEAE